MCSNGLRLSKKARAAIGAKRTCFACWYELADAHKARILGQLDELPMPKNDNGRRSLCWANQAESMARQVADQGRAAGERMQEVGRQALDRSIKDQPMATLATAAIVAFPGNSDKSLWRARATDA